MATKLSKGNLEKIKYLWDDKHKVDFIEAFMKIVDKDGNTVPFVLTSEQREIVENMAHQNIISKARQLGCSSIVVALSIRECIVNPNATCVLISHNQESTNTIFAKLKQMFLNLPEWLKPKITANNRQALTFETGASITCMTAGNKDCGRGATYNGIVHLSEFAFWKNQEGQLKSIMQAVSSSATVIIESTSNGFNKYSELCLQAKNGENSFKPFFFNWINGRTLFESQYKQAIKNYKLVHKNLLGVDKLEPEEVALHKMGATIDQLIWRRERVSVHGIDAFHVEFPATMEESFLVTGASVFDKEKIAKHLMAINEGKLTPLSVKQVVGIPATLKTYLGRSLSIWQRPQKGMKYFIGVDCSEGLKQDYSTAVVLDSNGEQVAEFRNNAIKPYQYTDVVNVLGRWYNKAKLTVEKASGGHSVIERLRKEKQYMNMTKYKTYNEFKRTIMRVGFDTNNKTKSLMVNDCREWFDKGLINIKSKNLLEEMQVFIAKDNGSMSAVNGSHDDLVMALCLCIQGIKGGLWYNF